MLISFGKGGESAQRAVDYMLADKDHKGEMRESVTVLRGNPQLTASIADGLDYKRTYSAGVIAWSPSEQPSRQEIEQVLDDFERVAFAGMSPDQYSWSAIEHGEADGGKHIHFIIARADLANNKAYNPAPPGWQKYYDPLRDYHNYLHGWASPADPAKRQLLEPGFLAHVDRKNTKQAITDYLVQRVQSGQVHNHEDVISKLSELGEVTRAGKDYISIRLEGQQKAVRLKGALYSKSFNVEQLKDIAQLAAERHEKGGILDAELAQQSYEQHQSAVTKRAEYNAQRHPYNKQYDYNYEQFNDYRAEPVVIPTAYSHDDEEPKKKQISSQFQSYKQKYASQLFDGEVNFTESFKYVNVSERMIVFDSGGLLFIEDKQISAARMNAAEAADHIIEAAKANGWKSIAFEGSDKFVETAIKQALKDGMDVKAHKDQIKKQTKLIERIKHEIEQEQRINNTRAEFNRTVESSEKDSKRFEQKIEQARKRSAEIDQSLSTLSEQVESLTQNVNKKERELEMQLEMKR